MSRVKYKLAIVFAVLVLLCGGLFAYFRWYSPLMPEEPVELQVWYSKSSVREGFEELVNGFNKGEGRYRQVSAEVRCFNDEEALLHELISADSTDKLPDAVICGTDISAYLQDEGMLTSVEKYITDVRAAEYESGILDACSRKNTLTCVPLMYETDMLIVNRELFGNVKALESFEELCSVANSYYMETREAFFTITDYSSFFRTAMTQLGESFTAENPFDSDNENLRYIYDLLATAAFKRGYAASTENPALLVAKGELPCAIVSSTQLAEAAESIDFSKVELAPVPPMEEGERVYTRDVFGISILKSDENTEKGAAIFVKWLSSEELIRELTGDSGFSPALNCDDSKETQKSAFSEAVLKVMSAMEYRDYYPSSDYAANSCEFNDIIDNIMKKSLS